MMPRLAYIVFVVLCCCCVQSARAQDVQIEQPFIDTLACPGKVFKVMYVVTGSFHSMNSFTVQLSDATGDFANAVDIGTVAGTTSGSVTVGIPPATPYGNNYRIRIVTTHPFFVSPDNGLPIRMISPPSPPVIANNSPVCEGKKLVVDVTNVQNLQIDSLVWSGGVFSGPSPGPKTLTYNNAYLGLTGSYTIVRIDKKSKCPSTAANTQVYVKPLPPKPQATATSPVCEGGALQLNATATPAPDGYSWQGPGFSSTQQNPYIEKLPASGKGWYLVHSVQNGCYSGESDSVFVDIIAAPDLTITTNSPLCDGEDLFASAHDTGNIVYTWKGPNGFEMQDSTFTINNARTKATGLYYIHTERNGCKSTDSIYLHIKPYPHPTILSSNSPVCEGDTLFISSVNVANPAIVAYNFYGPDGASLIGTKPVFPNATQALQGMYVFVANMEGCITRDSLEVVVKPTPVVTTNKEFVVTVEEPVQLVANSNIPGTSFYWEGPNGFTTTEQNPTIESVTERNKGIYKVTATFDGCSADTTTEVGVWYPTDYTLFEIDPNPNNGSFTLTGRVKKPQDVEIGVYQAGSGIVIYKDKITSNGKLVNKTIHLHSHLVSGEYILKARADGEVQAIKFVIMK